jgi:hypothetical protein
VQPPREINERRNMFYEKCAEILGTTYECESFPYRRRTRWNNRSPGNGRYEGFGLIRKFGDNYQVALTHPISYHAIFHSEEEVFAFLRSLSL